MERHDYEPGDRTHPMHTDPMCRVCGRPKRDHELDDELDPWLTSAEAAELAGMTGGAWRKLVSDGLAPVADDPGDLSAHVRRRNPRWRKSSVVRYMAKRRVHRGGRKPGDV